MSSALSNVMPSIECKILRSQQILIFVKKPFTWCVTPSLVPTLRSARRSISEPQEKSFVPLSRACVSPTSASLLTYLKPWKSFWSWMKSWGPHTLIRPYPWLSRGWTGSTPSKMWWNTLAWMCTTNAMNYLPSTSSILNRWTWLTHRILRWALWIVTITLWAKINNSITKVPFKYDNF